MKTSTDDVKNHILKKKEVKKREAGFTLMLRFPSSVLNPNFQCHWAKKAQAKKAYKHTCWALTQETTKGRFKRASKVTITFDFHPPRRGRYDEDNLLARMKSGIDGIALALETDDSLFHYSEMSVREPIKNGLVVASVRMEW